MAGKELLAEVRVDIDRVDGQIMELFKERMKLAEEVASIKSEHNLSMMDENRENEKVESVVGLIDPDLRGEVSVFMRTLMALSRSRQRKKLFGNPAEFYFPVSGTPKTGDIKVAFQGVPGAWGEEAALQLFSKAELDPFNTFEDVFQAVKDKKADYGIVPIENSQTGGIGEVHDLLRKYGCYIIGQTWVAALQCLMALPGAELSDIREVFSHPEGLKQCDKFLRGRAWDLTACRNTAVAAEMVATKGDKRYAAIGSRRAAQLNGLAILAPDIVTDPNNKTRFIVISDIPEYDDTCDTVSVIFRTANRSGALVDALFPLVSGNINMKRLESRPMSDRKYCFFCDLEGNMSDENLIQALRQVSASSGYLEILGCYHENTKKR